MNSLPPLMVGPVFGEEIAGDRRPLRVFQTNPIFARACTGQSRRWFAIFAERDAPGSRPRAAVTGEGPPFGSRAQAQDEM